MTMKGYFTEKTQNVSRIRYEFTAGEVAIQPLWN